MEYRNLFDRKKCSLRLSIGYFLIKLLDGWSSGIFFRLMTELIIKIKAFIEQTKNL